METTVETKTAAWELDKSHAKLGFTITHMMVSEVGGSFKNFDIKLKSDTEDFSDARVELSADINSIDTQNETRDAHMRKEDFFHVSKHPSLHFKNGNLIKTTDGKYQLKGDLTLMETTKPVTLDVKMRLGKNPMSGKTIAGFKVTGTINRSDFALAPAAPGIVLSNEVDIVANAEFIKS